MTDAANMTFWYGSYPNTPRQKVIDDSWALVAAEAAPAWGNGTSSQGQATVNRRAPLTAILVSEDQASQDTKKPATYSTGRSRAVVDRTTGKVRTEEDEELRRGAVLLR